jgi:hypothetical protein
MDFEKKTIMDIKDMYFKEKTIIEFRQKKLLWILGEKNYNDFLAKNSKMESKQKKFIMDFKQKKQ